MCFALLIFGRLYTDENLFDKKRKEFVHNIMLMSSLKSVANLGIHYGEEKNDYRSNN